MQALTAAAIDALSGVIERIVIGGGDAIRLANAQRVLLENLKRTLGAVSNNRLS